MESQADLARIVRPADRLLMVVGGFGSGKTEVAVNLAVALSESGRRVQIADLDLVNPYFRCREAKALMEARGVRVVVPAGAQAWADLPIVLPEIRGMLSPPEGVVSLFDVGGDDVGARALSAFRPELREGAYELWLVVNSKRPFTRTVEGCLEMRDAIEGTSRLRVTGLFANSHLVEETRPEDVLEGWRLAAEVARQTGLPVRGVAALEALAGSPLLERIEAPLLRLRRRMLPPWLVRSALGREPAPSPRPIGVPPTGDAHGTHRG